LANSLAALRHLQYLYDTQISILINNNVSRNINLLLPQLAAAPQPWRRKIICGLVNEISSRDRRVTAKKVRPLSHTHIRHGLRTGLVRNIRKTLKATLQNNSQAALHALNNNRYTLPYTYTHGA
tara:strand:- start:127 stop:498 length:372 start_codon:yes stop_codon:yes gene_type:complete